MDVVGAVRIDEWLDPGTGCLYQLYESKSIRGEEMPKLLKMQSPELQDGQRPFYVESVPPGINSCRAARRWQFRKPDGSWPSVWECNEVPALAFDVES